MIQLHPQPLDTVDDLRAALQNAIMLEHATIPPYLTALATLRGTSASVRFARAEIRDVVLEEMLHMTLACNILNAIGGRPILADRSVVPTYPSELPMGVAGGLVVHLRRYSKQLVENTFMKIEEPETILQVPELPQVTIAGPSITIGQFYAGIGTRIAGHPEVFTGDPARQVTAFFDPGEDINVTDVDSALRAIDVIVEQGEGTSQTPLDFQQDVAHFYSFQQFSKGMRIVVDPDSPVQVSFDPAQPINIDDNVDVIPMVDDPPLVTYDPVDARAEQLSAEADRSYSNMLRGLDRAFNGDPDSVFARSGPVDVMSEFQDLVNELVNQQLTAGPFAGQFAGPRFRFVE